MTENHMHEDDDQISYEDLVEENNFLLEALISLLIDKKVISQDELNTKIEQMEKELDDEEDEE